MRGILGLLPLLAGCTVITVPPQAPFGLYAPPPEPGTVGVNLFADVGLLPTAGGMVELPQGDGTAELGGQVSFRSFALRGALWRDLPDTENGAMRQRFGMAAGAGDLLGIYPYRMPFLGASYHVQWMKERPRTLQTRTLGLSALVPIPTGNLLDPPEGYVIVRTWPDLWLNARWAWAFPVGETGDRAIVAAGVDVEFGVFGIPGLLATPLAPMPAVGATWQFGKDPR